MDRLFKGVIDALVTLVLVAFGMCLLAELLQRGLMPAGIIDSPVVAVVAVIFIAGLIARLSRARSEKKGHGAERRAPRTIADGVAPWSSTLGPSERRRPRRGRDA